MKHAENLQGDAPLPDFHSDMGSKQLQRALEQLYHPINILFQLK